MRKSLLVALLLLLLLASCRKEQPTQPDLVLRYADNQSSGYPTVEAAKYLAQLVKERTGGRIEIMVYPDSVLGTEMGVMQQMSYGGIDMSRFSLGTLSQVFPELWILQLPYLYSGNEHMWRVLDGEIGDMYLHGMSGKGIVGLAWYDAGARSFYTRMPITNFASLKGMTIRVQENDMMSRTIELLGAKAVQIPYGDIYSALQKLRIDGAENNLPSYVFMGHNQAAPYFYQDEHFRLPEVVMISNDAQQKVAAVDPAFVDVITQCAKESGLYERELWQEEEKRAYDTALASGVTFTTPSEEDLVNLRKAMDPLYQELSKEQLEIVERIGDA